MRLVAIARIWSRNTASNRTRKLDMKRQGPRDERMYKQTEAYRPEELRNVEVVDRLLEDLQYSKENNLEQLYKSSLGQDNM